MKKPLHIGLTAIALSVSASVAESQINKTPVVPVSDPFGLFSHTEFDFGLQEVNLSGDQERADFEAIHNFGAINPTVEITTLNPNTGEYDTVCTGVIISSDEVLTAASCLTVVDMATGEVTPDYSRSLTVRLSDGTMIEGEVPSNYLWHEKYFTNPTGDATDSDWYSYDVGILVSGGDDFVEEPSYFNFPQVGTSQVVVAGQTLFQAGYGIQSTNNPDQTTGLRFIDYTRMSDNCTHGVPEVGTSHTCEAQLIEANESNRTCYGDMGAPNYRIEGSKLAISSIRSLASDSSCEKTTTLQGVDWNVAYSIKIEEVSEWILDNSDAVEYPEEVTNPPIEKPEGGKNGGSLSWTMFPALLGLVWLRRKKK